MRLPINIEELLGGRAVFPYPYLGNGHGASPADGLAEHFEQELRDENHSRPELPVRGHEGWRHCEDRQAERRAEGAISTPTGRCS